MSLCPHGYTAFWDCPECPEPMGTREECVTAAIENDCDFPIFVDTATVIDREAIAWERFNAHIRTCKGCKDFDAHGWLCNEGEVLSDEWKALREATP